MPLKNKTFVAFTVKLLFAVSALQAQQTSDSAKQKNISFLPLTFAAAPVKILPKPNQLPANFYARQLPFFCSKELKIQKAIGFPVKFRVGSVEYCDKLEGKNR